MSSIHLPGAAVVVSAPTTRLHRPSRPHRSREQSPATDSSLATIAQRLDLVRQHGDFSLAYATAVQSRLAHFGDEDGYIAYGQRLGFTFVLGDPVAAPQHRSRLLEQFVESKPGATFCQVSALTARTLQQCGFYVNEMGVDTFLPLPEYNFQGQEKEWLRYAANWTNRRGFAIREETTEQVGAAEVASVSAAWRATRTVRSTEVRFLNRPLVIPDEPGVRRFYFYDADNRLLAFAFFDPLYRAGQLVGYVACIKRRHPDAPIYAEQAIMKHAIEVFRREGCQELRLGLSPFAWIEDREHRSNWLLNKMFRYGFSAGWVNKFFYNLQGHATYKRRFRGREEKVYFATRARFNTLRMMAFIKLCKLV